MKTTIPKILVINSGSSSIKFAFYQNDTALKRGLHGTLERIGLSGTNLSFAENEGGKVESIPFNATEYVATVALFLDWLREQDGMQSVETVGHRVVHGMKHTQPEVVTQKLLEELHRISTYDPAHLPGEIELMEAFRKKYPKLTQVACFDTAFHHSMPRVAKLLPIPWRYEAMGLKRYGFHGLSYAYLMHELKRVDPVAAQGRVILAHLGNGASLAAVIHGKSIDTSMGFTPTSGMMMSTRSGDLDPGLVNFLARTENMTPAHFDHLANHESGLLGLSGTSSDMRDLLELEKKDARAADAVDLFCYQTKKWIGSFAAALGGLETLIFSGGIGENSPTIRERICDGLGFLGVELDPSRNAINAELITSDAGRVAGRVFRTDEELMIARSVNRLLEVK
ncbi:MAG TPA: acetate/propionate family kinase [Verrucomicrobiales bacterium]|nr:acetate/propionate family kinase [Verrucomicrobiales bacterium]